MNRRVVGVLAAMTGAAVVLLACSSSGSGSSGGATPGAVSSIDMSKSGASLSTDDAKKLCGDLGTFESARITADDRKHASCVGLAFFSIGFTKYSSDAALQGACTKAYDDCVAKPATGATPPTRDCAKFATSLAACPDVTVAEIDQCEADYVSGLQSVDGHATCSVLHMGDGGMVVASPGSFGMSGATSCQKPNACAGLAVGGKPETAGAIGG